ncbi:MAG: hypothetical protein BWK80_28930 [Desulfobacteraceae bacterium IS3]|nr:MAG: hypothetical protein BWK80_28930 [Desulfobacteraceae bacterium IS3]
MGITEKRKHRRFDSLNLSYLCVDEKGDIIYQGMGRTLNVSESGILLETVFGGINRENIVELTIALEDDLVDIKGTVVRCKAGESETSEAGIEFLEMDLEALRILKKFINLFEKQKEDENKEN